jgi:hypothetical protein
VPPIRVVHALAPSETKTFQPVPEGKLEWSRKSFANPLKNTTEPYTELFATQTPDETKMYDPKFLYKRKLAMQEQEIRARSLESGELGRQRALFISKTRFFGAPDEIAINEESGAISQRFPLQVRRTRIPSLSLSLSVSFSVSCSL